MRKALISWFDLLFCMVLVTAGITYLQNCRQWIPAVYIGNAQYGDAEFWWNGALHFSQGIIANNPNLTYRMGYAVIGGLLTAVLGPDYPTFHLLLLGLFLIAACALYLSFRALKGRTTAVASAVLLVFNPYTGQWLATSSSDGLGMLFHLGSLLAIIKGLHNGIRLRWIALFGLLFACGSLTRPLMTLFLIPTLFAIFVTGWRQKKILFLATSTILATFFIPILVWMSVMAAITGNFAITGQSQDSSTFYAASDPQIQVWQGSMYTFVQESAKKRFSVTHPTPQQLNQEFWNLTLQNYRQHWKYHLKRFLGHSVAIAQFTPEKANPATHNSRRLRVLVKVLFLVILLGVWWWQLPGKSASWSQTISNRFAFAAAVVLGALWILTPSFSLLAVMGISILLMAGIFQNNITGFLLAAYWWVGLLALYLVGGTSGITATVSPYLNALGYRLGFQFFFLNDLLILYTLGCMVRSKRQERRITVLSKWFQENSPWATRIAAVLTLGILTAYGLLLSIGAGLVGQRIIDRRHSISMTYPNLTTLAPHPLFRDAKPSNRYPELMAAIHKRSGEKLITTAMSSGFLWNLPDQRRCLLLIYQQENVLPIEMHPRRMDLEVPQHLEEKEWQERQGLWLIRSFPDLEPKSHMPYYRQQPAIQAFLPLSQDRKTFDLSRLSIFPIVKYASQLVASGELIFHGRQPNWVIDSGKLQYPRRFSLGPADPVSAALELELNLYHARGPKQLRFGIQLISTNTGPSQELSPTLTLLLNDGQKDSFLTQNTLNPKNGSISWFDVPISENAKSVTIKMNGLHSTDVLWFYEWNLKAEDFIQ